MVIYKLNGDKIEELAQTTFSKEKINEARDLQRFIINSIEAIDKDLLVISSEFGDWEDSRRRIDILCIDKDANLVVIELKRTEKLAIIRLTPIEKAAINKQYAEARFPSKSSFLRFKIFGDSSKKRYSTADEKRCDREISAGKLLGELKLMGDSVNQIAKKMNTFKDGTMNKSELFTLLDTVKLLVEIKKRLLQE